MGMVRRWSSAFTAARTSRPSMRGMLRSSSTRSGVGASAYSPSLRRKAMASTPSPTTWSRPVDERIAMASWVRRTSPGSSSTRRTLTCRSGSVTQRAFPAGGPGTQPAGARRSGGTLFAELARDLVEVPPAQLRMTGQARADEQPPGAAELVCLLQRLAVADGRVASDARDPQVQRRGSLAARGRLQRLGTHLHAAAAEARHGRVQPAREQDLLLRGVLAGDVRGVVQQDELEVADEVLDAHLGREQVVDRHVVQDDGDLVVG